MYTIVNSGPLARYITVDVDDGFPVLTRWRDLATRFVSRSAALPTLARARVEYPDENLRLTRSVPTRSRGNVRRLHPLVLTWSGPQTRRPQKSPRRAGVG